MLHSMCLSRRGKGGCAGDNIDTVKARAPRHASLHNKAEALWLNISHLCTVMQDI